MSSGQQVRALCVLVTLCGGPAAAQTELVQATTPDGRSVTLLTSNEESVVTDAHGSHELDLPAGARVDRIAVLEGGWIAAGSRGTTAESELLLLVADGDPIAPISPPPNPSADVRHGAVPLVENGRLVGVAWLEGSDYRSLAVRAAALSGSQWNGPETISAGDGAEQLAVQGTVLADGTWLIVWSRAEAEGHSDTMWSRRSADGLWTKPHPVHPDNETHDIVPAIFAIGDGALAAWSRLEDREYRLVLARFNGRRWIDTGFDDVGGTLYPTFTHARDGARLLYRKVVPSGWKLLDLAADATVRRAAWVPRGPRLRPAVGTDDEGLLRWPAGDAPTLNALPGGDEESVVAPIWEERP